MRYIVSGKEMRLLDQNTSGFYKVPELVLMEQAALAFVKELSSLLESFVGKRGIVFCGAGNNGADGMAIARLLQERGADMHICRIIDVWRLSATTSSSYQTQAAICESYGYKQITDIQQLKNQNFDFVIDAVFGIGLSRELDENYQEIFSTINNISGIKIAVDMPSGIHSDNGQIMGTAIKCDYTITFSYGKCGQYLWPGCEYAGRTIVSDIGITNRSWLERKPSLGALEQADLYYLPKRPQHSNKGTFGKLLIIAGSSNMAGAAILSARAAYRSGVGLVKVMTPEENREIIQKSLPEAILSTYANIIDETSVIQDIKWSDAIVIGPGIGTGELAKTLVAMVRKYAEVPVLLDADALNIIAQDTNTLLLPHTETVVTPHLGEFSRLSGNSVEWTQSHLIESALDFARTYDVICVLKDFRTITGVPYGMSYINMSGNNGMATAGSGDVLSGIIGAFLAQGMRAEEASAYGVYIHGLAGDIAAKSMGTHGVTASDIVDGIKEVWNKLEN